MISRYGLLLFSFYNLMISYTLMIFGTIWWFLATIWCFLATTWWFFGTTWWFFGTIYDDFSVKYDDFSLQFDDFGTIWFLPVQYDDFSVQYDDFSVYNLIFSGTIWWFLGTIWWFLGTTWFVPVQYDDFSVQYDDFIWFLGTVWCFLCTTWCFFPCNLMIFRYNVMISRYNLMLSRYNTVDMVIYFFSLQFDAFSDPNDHFSALELFGIKCHHLRERCAFTQKTGVFFRPDVGQKNQSTGVLIDIRLTRRKLRYQMLHGRFVDPCWLTSWISPFHCSSFSSKAVKSRSSATSYKLVAVRSSLLYPRTPRSTNRLWRTPAHARLFGYACNPLSWNWALKDRWNVGPWRCAWMLTCLKSQYIYIDR